MRLIQLYRWGNKDGMVPTVNGEMPYLDWLQKEETRLKKNPNRMVELRFNGKQCSLFVDGYCSAPFCREPRVNTHYCEEHKHANIL